MKHSESAAACHLTEISKKRKEMIRTLAKRIIKKHIGTPAELIAGGVLVGAALVGISESEKNNPEFANYEIDGKGKIDRDIRLVFLSDLHEKEFGERNCRLIKMIDEAHPDIVLIGGDMVVGFKNNKKHEHRTSVALQLCRDLAGKYPVYYANGNHEMRLNMKAFREALDDFKVTCLSNETVRLCDTLAITGLDLDEAQYAPVKPSEPTEEEIKSKIGKLPQECFNILLAHSPLFLDSYAKTGADLVLAGHFHGGTIRIGKDVGLMTPQYQFFSRKVVGMSQKEGCFMIVSAGLGTHSINIRINDRPQVVVVDIKK